MNANERYSWDFKISSFDAGAGRAVKPSSILKLQQEVGEKQLSELGLGYKRLYDDGFVFVLVRTAVLIHKAPLFGDNVKLTTWNRGAKGAMFRRCYVWQDEQGSPLIESKTFFALADAKTHALLRPSAFERYGLTEYVNLDNACFEPAKIKLPEMTSEPVARPIRYSDLDYNGHLNNAVYADFITDFMPAGMNAPIRSFSIHFAGEAKLGDCLDIYTHTDGGGVYYLGTHERGTCFSAYCER